MASLVTPANGDDVTAESVAQLTEMLSGIRNIPANLTAINDPSAYALTVKNVGTGGKDIVVYAPDGTTVLFQVTSSGVSISPAGGAAAAAVTQTGTETLTNKTITSTTNSIGGTALSADPPAANQITVGSLLKGWLYSIVTAGVPAVTNSYNVSGIVDNGVGDLSVTWNTDFQFFGGAFQGVVVGNTDNGLVSIITLASGVTRLRNQTPTTGALVDPGFWQIMAAGVQ